MTIAFVIYTVFLGGYVKFYKLAAVRLQLARETSVSCTLALVTFGHKRAFSYFNFHSMGYFYNLFKWNEGRTDVSEVSSGSVQRSTPPLSTH
jgi:hypothetical protein